MPVGAFGGRGGGGGLLQRGAERPAQCCCTSGDPYPPRWRVGLEDLGAKGGEGRGHEGDVSLRSPVILGELFWCEVLGVVLGKRVAATQYKRDLYPLVWINWADSCGAGGGEATATRHWAEF